MTPRCNELKRTGNRDETDTGKDSGPAFHWHLLDKGIGHIRFKPATPRLNGKVERSHRIDSEEFYRLLEGQVIDDVNLFNDRLQQWEDFYNYGRVLGGSRMKSGSPDASVGG